MADEDLELDEEIDLDQFTYLDKDFSLDDLTVDPIEESSQINWELKASKPASKPSMWHSSKDIAASVISQPLPTVLETEREKQVKTNINVDYNREALNASVSNGGGIGYEGTTGSDDAMSKFDLEVGGS